MIDLFFATILPDPGWLAWIGIFGAPFCLVLNGWLFYKLDARYTTKREFITAVNELQKADARVEGLVKTLTETVDRHHEERVSAFEKFTESINAGFIEINRTFGEGILQVSKDVARLEGRMAGAGGLNKNDSA